MHWKVRKGLDALVLLLLSALDARDLYYKTQWLGPNDAFAFTFKSSVLLFDQPQANTKLSNSSTGWQVFHDTCNLQTLTQTSNSQSATSQYTYILAANCSAPDDLIEEMTPQISTMLLASDIRVDAMAWAACTLLYIFRRPPLCQDAMVTRFLHKYRLNAPLVTTTMMAAPMSGAERELRALLDVIGKSVPLRRVVCVGGVEIEQLSTQRALRPIFGCAGPGIATKTVAFVGHFATGFATLQKDKARLSVDDVKVFGMHFRFRQNAIHSFTYLPSPSTASDKESHLGRMEVSTALNLACSGFLFNEMILIDIVLLILHVWTSVELFQRLILLPFGRSSTKQGMRDRVEAEGSTTLFACSLVHSTPVAILSVLSGLLSWLLLLPHTAVWELRMHEASLSFAEIHTLLSGLRVWVLLLQVVHFLWGLFVLIDEGRAYMVVTRTYISSSELVAAVLVAGYQLRHRLLSILPTKHEMEYQRVIDRAAFPGRMTTSNAFEDRVHLLTTRSYNFNIWMIYIPLIELLCLSLLITSMGVVTRYLYLDYYRRKAKQANTAVVGVDKSKDLKSFSSQAPSRMVFSSAQASMAGYKRLPLEELLDLPIRSKHIVRSGVTPIELERTVGDEQYLWPAQCLAHGVLLENDRFLSTRRGFYRVLPMHELVDANVDRPSKDLLGEETNGSPKRRRYTVDLE